jgi:hypothetical protein
MNAIIHKATKRNRKNSNKTHLTQYQQIPMYQIQTQTYYPYEFSNSIFSRKYLTYLSLGCDIVHS